jgi:hypothetical protein
MSHSLFKNIYGIGKVEFKLASNRLELEQAFGLVYEEYEARGLILAKHYKAPLRAGIYHALPGSVVLVALYRGKVAGTLSILPDSNLGLPMEQGYQEEVDQLRKMDRRIAEIGYLALSSDLFKRGQFSMFNFSKFDFMCTLFKLMNHYVCYEAKFDDICIVTNPKLMIFKFIPFEIIGPVKYYGFDYSSINKKPAVLKRLNLHTLKEKLSFLQKNLFLGPQLHRNILEHRCRLSIEDLKDLFVEKSDLLVKSTEEEKRFIASCYNLSSTELEQLLS